MFPSIWTSGFCFLCLYINVVHQVCSLQLYLIGFCENLLCGTFDVMLCESSSLVIVFLFGICNGSVLIQIILVHAMDCQYFAFFFLNRILDS